MGKQIIVNRKSYSGPLPHPEDMARYNEIVPNAAERILAMAEKQQAHQIELENKMIKSQVRGQLIGMTLALIVLCISVYCVSLGYLYLASMFGLPVLVWILAVFVLKKEPKQTPTL